MLIAQPVAAQCSIQSSVTLGKFRYKMARLMTSLHLYLWAVFLCVTSCLSQEPTLNVGPVTAKYEGESLELICEVQNLNGSAVAWLKGTNPITSNQERYIQTANETTATYTLTILNLTREVDTAIHHCAVYTSQTLTDLVKQVSTEVIVYYFPDDTYPVCNPNGQTVITEGLSAMFHCESDPGELPVVVAWSRSDMQMIEEDITTGDENGMRFAKYTFVPTKNDIDISVSCTISSNAIFPGKTSTCTVGPLVVQYRPSDVAITNQTYIVANTTYDALSCSATAFPPDISYSWSFNTPLDSSQQMVTDDNQILVILNITSCDSPIIATCLATNDIGNRAVNFTLCEPPPPPNPVCNPNGQAVLTEGIPKMFTCVSLPGGSPEWSRDMGMITENNIARGDLPNGYKYANYTFVPTTDDIGVNFTCTVMTDPLLPDTCTIGPVLIRHVPSDVALTNQTYSVGNTTYDALSCSASAFPPNISYSWSFNIPLDSSQQMVTNDNQTLVILNITSCDSPIIATCLASNDIGNRAINFTLCEPPPPPANKSLTKPQAGAVTPAILSVIIGGGIILFALVIGVVCIILCRHGDSGEMDKMEIDEDIPQTLSAKVQLKQDSRVMEHLYETRLASICYTEEDILEEDRCPTQIARPGVDSRSHQRWNSE